MAIDDRRRVGNPDGLWRPVGTQGSNQASNRDPGQPPGGNSDHAGDSPPASPARSALMDTLIAENEWLQTEVERLQGALDALNNALEDDGK